MKLSKKGIETIFSALLKTIEERDLVFRQISQGVFKKHIEALNFEPDDFESPHPFLEKQGIESEKGKPSHHVVLTIDQAKELALKLKNNAEFFFLQTGEFDYDTDELWQCLTDKIEQAKIFQIGEDYNKALNRVAEEFQKQAEKP